MLRFSDQVLDVLEGEGIKTSEVEEMLSRAAITSLRGANRRYHQWLFVLQADLVVRMFKVLPGQEHLTRWEPHEKCRAWGCLKCGWSGEVPTV